MTDRRPQTGFIRAGGHNAWLRAPLADGHHARSYEFEALKYGGELGALAWPYVGTASSEQFLVLGELLRWGEVRCGVCRDQVAAGGQRADQPLHERLCL